MHIFTKELRLLNSAPFRHIFIYEGKEKLWKFMTGILIPRPVLPTMSILPLSCIILSAGCFQTRVFSKGKSPFHSSCSEVTNITPHVNSAQSLRICLAKPTLLDSGFSLHWYCPGLRYSTIHPCKHWFSIKNQKLPKHNSQEVRYKWIPHCGMAINNCYRKKINQDLFWNTNAW